MIRKEKAYLKKKTTANIVTEEAIANYKIGIKRKRNRITNVGDEYDFDI